MTRSRESLIRGLLTAAISSPVVDAQRLAHPAAESHNSDSSYCSRPSIRTAAARAVAKATVSALGTGDVNVYRREFDKLRVENSPTGMALKARLKQQHPEYDDLEICVVPADRADWLQTFVVRKGHRVGGLVINFGVPGQPAYFGDLGPAEL